MVLLRFQIPTGPKTKLQVIQKSGEARLLLLASLKDHSFSSFSGNFLCARLIIPEVLLLYCSAVRMLSWETRAHR